MILSIAFDAILTLTIPAQGLDPQTYIEICDDWIRMEQPIDADLMCDLPDYAMRPRARPEGLGE